MSVKKLLLLLTTLFPLYSVAQLHVIQVSGRIKLKNQNPVRVGSTLSMEASLEYSSQNDSLRAIDDLGQVTVFRAPHKTNPISLPEGFFSQQLSNFIQKSFQAVDYTLLPHNHNFISGLKANSYEFITTVTQDSILLRPKVIIQDSNRYMIDTLKYPVKTGKFLLQGLSNGKLQLLQKINAYKDTLSVSYKDFLKVSRPKTAQAYNLLYQRDGSNLFEVVNNIKPFFDVAGEMRAMVFQMIKNKPVGLTKEKLYENIFTQVNATFGKPAELDFKDLFETDYTFLTKLKTLEIPNRSDAQIKIDKQKVTEPANKFRLLTFTDRPNDNVNYLRQYAPESGDQGVTNSCTAWAAAYCAQSIDYNKRPLNSKKTAFSPEFVFKGLKMNDDICDKKTEGVDIGEVLGFLQDNGGLTKNDNTFDCPAPYTNEQYIQAKTYRTLKSHPLFTYTAAALTDDAILLIKEALRVQNKPVIISVFLPAPEFVFGIKIPNSFESLYGSNQTAFWEPYTEEYTKLNHRSLIGNLIHTMCIVGYDNNRKDGCFEILNSYGKNWGVSGYAYMNYKDFKNWGIAAFVIDNDKPANIAFAAITGKFFNNVILSPSTSNTRRNATKRRVL